MHIIDVGLVGESWISFWMIRLITFEEAYVAKQSFPTKNETTYLFVLEVSGVICI